MWLGVLVIPAALGLVAVPEISISILLSFLVECCLSGLAAAIIYTISRYLMRPAVMPAAPFVRVDSTQPPPVSEPAPQPWVRPQVSEDEPTDIIMIDLD